MSTYSTHKAFFTCFILVTLIFAQSTAQITFAKGWDRKEHSKLGDRDMLRQIVQRSPAAAAAAAEARDTGAGLAFLKLFSILSNQRQPPEFLSLRPEERNIVYDYLTRSDKTSQE